MISYISYNYSIHICILPRNGHYHACKLILHLMLLLKSKRYCHMIALDLRTAPNAVDW